MALTGYAIPVLLIGLAQRVESFKLKTEVVNDVGVLLIVLYLALDSWMTVKRFFHVDPRPDGLAVSAHFTGLVLGVLWFAWRRRRHGTYDA
ncbi:MULTISPECIES: hypothetical protein [Halorussus]|uniref:hypothetical protein n=1 Tax=Halorussus TaxID=1070314 RepID=UPI00209EBF45|nr:hypothetical protein [Halorussus vallis]USZ75564.1 hypothetical protein NGM07_19305 [Halorussus vallis]